jgi:tRNA(Glu) U13 pseudouridine synthase TruD
MLLKSVPEDFCVREFLVPNIQPAGEPGRYNLYLLRKRGWNTEDCVSWLCTSLRVQRKTIGLCGNKDKHAVTEQYVTMEARTVPRVIRTPDGFSLTFLGTTRDALYLGAHKRNVFTITVRELPVTAHIETEKPVLNLFGEQRFGTNTAQIGFHLLRKDYRAAADALGLTYTTDPISALRTVPKRTLILHVHAAQSALWNEAARRAAAHGALDANAVLALPGYGEPVTLDIGNALHEHGLTSDCFVNRSMSELSLEGGTRMLVQGVQDFSTSPIVLTKTGGVCTLRFSLGQGEYATETIRQRIMLNAPGAYAS